MKAKLLSVSILSGVAAATLIVSPALAWHPVGTIQKQVQDVTSNSGVVSAKDDAHALSVAPGDILVYTITIGNHGTPDSQGKNDMASTTITDNLPKGVALVSDPSKHTVTFNNLGNIAPGASVTKTITVKVISEQDGATIDNEACFCGNSTVNDNPQSGCDHAVVKVKVPVTPVTPVTPPTTSTPAPQVKAATTLVNTGAGNVFTWAIAATVLGYLGSLFVKSRRAING
jgi:uncharacterized repeat protein (TIGR01451 family)